MSSYIPYGQKFSRTKNFAVFVDQTRTSKILSSKILPEFFLITRTTHTHAVRGATCQHMTFSRSQYTLLSCCVDMALYRYFSSFGEIQLQANRSSWSSLEINTFVVDRICLRESAECVGKQGAHSEWAKGTTLLQARSRTEDRRSAGEQVVVATVRLYACQAMGVVNLKVGGAITASSKIKSRKVQSRLIRENFSPRKFLAIRYYKLLIQQKIPDSSLQVTVW